MLSTGENTAKYARNFNFLRGLLFMPHSVERRTPKMQSIVRYLIPNFVNIYNVLSRPNLVNRQTDQPTDVKTFTP